MSKFKYLEILEFITDGMSASPSKVYSNISEDKRKLIFSRENHCSRTAVVCGHISNLKKHGHIEERKGRYYLKS